MLESVYDSVEFEGAKNCVLTIKTLKKINQLTDHYRNLSMDELEHEAKNFGTIDLKTKIIRYALGREVCYRLLGKFHYDVQILGAPCGS